MKIHKIKCGGYTVWITECGLSLPINYKHFSKKWKEITCKNCLKKKEQP